MIRDRFDAVARALSAAGTRRSLVGALGGGLVALATPLSVGEPIALAAKKRNKNKKKKSKKDKQNRCPKARRCKKTCCRKGQTCQKGVCKRKRTTPPEPEVTRVRRDLHSLSVAELDSLAKGVAEMKRRSNANPNDPTGWEFQANVHWENCQHNTIHFLSWHRMYLYYFEQILRDAAGDPELTLPYWDYSIPANRILPGPFRDSANDLYDPSRRQIVNAGGQPGPEDEYLFDAEVAMGLTNFTHYGNGTSFGGRVGARGSIENSPHNHVHGWVGGNMNSLRLAALDPVFWLHHANIDRLWEVWLRQGGGRANPTSGEFLTTKYQFHDANGNQVTMTGRKILDTATQLHYTYAGQEPLSPAALSGSGDSSLGVAGAVKSSVIGSKSGGLTLDSRPVNVEIPLKAGASDSLAATGATKQRTTLTFIGVAGAGVPGVTYEVHVNANGRSPRPTDASFVGAIGLFGLQPDDHPGHHHHSAEISFDITKWVRSGKRIDVTLVPSLLPGSGGRANRTWATIDAVKISVEGATSGGQKKKTTNKKKRQKKNGGKQGTTVAPRTKQQRASQNRRKRTVNRKQKQQANAAHQAPAAAQSTIPGGKTTTFSTDAGDKATSGHAHH